MQRYAFATFPGRLHVINLQYSRIILADHSIHRSFQTKTLQETLDKRSLSALFQPIMNISEGTLPGFEGLMRDPADSLLPVSRLSDRYAKHFLKKSEHSQKK